MSEWFVRYKSGKKRYIPARQILDTEYETFGEYTDRNSAEALVRALNAGVIKPEKKKGKQ